MLVTQTEVLTGDLHAVAVAADGGDAVRLGNRAGLVLDFDLKEEGGHAGEFDGDSLLVRLLLGAELEGLLPRFGEGCGWFGVDALLDGQGVEGLVYIIEIVCQAVELVGVVACFGGV